MNTASLISILFIGFSALAGDANGSNCDIIVHMRSVTDKSFQGQIIAANGQKSEKWNFTKNRQRETFHQKATDCGVGNWKILTFGPDGSEAGKQEVGIDGVGRVVYEVGNDLKPVQKERQGAACTGEQCAALGYVPPPPSPRNRTASITKDA